MIGNGRLQVGCDLDGEKVESNCSREGVSVKWRKENGNTRTNPPIVRVSPSTFRRSSEREDQGTNRLVSDIYHEVQ